ncbi:hypothetical protein [Paraburkholderia oxyphila]|uniref:hypothetical protein n=1 Tax=Paraburkholderia oxyphila TaxID=614212 RepID=UPI0012EEB032|nr:hypothetical protein [Paraburkholderia oxyphila]
MTAVHRVERRQIPAGLVQVRVEAILHFLQDVWATTAPGGLIASPVHYARA